MEGRIAPLFTMKQVKYHEGEMLYQAYLAWKELGGFEEYDIEEFIREVKSVDTAGWPQRVKDFVDGFKAATILSSNAKDNHG